MCTMEICAPRILMFVHQCNCHTATHVDRVECLCWSYYKRLASFLALTAVVACVQGIRRVRSMATLSSTGVFLLCLTMKKLCQPMHNCMRHAGLSVCCSGYLADWDNYYEQISIFTRYVPFMTVPG
jgi:hypothetical protein